MAAIYDQALAAKGAGYLRAHGLAGLRRSVNQGGKFLPNISLSHYVAMHQFAERLDDLNEKRRSLQANRVRSDKDLAPLFADPFRPTWNDPDYVRFHRRLSWAIGVRDRFANPASETARG